MHIDDDHNWKYNHMAGIGYCFCIAAINFGNLRQAKKVSNCITHTNQPTNPAG